ALAARQRERVVAAQAHGALRRPQEAVRDARQRALSRRVGSDQADHLARIDAQRDAADRLPAAAAVPVAHARELEQGPGHVRLRRSSTKRGAPSSAVTAPTGGSAPRPRKSRRATASASTRKAAPPRAEAGRTTRWSGPVSRRTACGTTRPTKPTSPV